MRIISHRGNLQGPDPTTENHPDMISHVLKDTPFDVEIDVWYDGNNLFLGHDCPQYETTLKFIDNPRFWIHAKNIEALTYLLTHIVSANVFSHDKDPAVITYPKSLVWLYPGQLTPCIQQCIIVLPETTPTKYNKKEMDSAYGVCTDYPLDIMKKKVIN